MIQRKQSIFLFLMVALCSFSLITNPAIYKFISGSAEGYNLEVGYVKVDKLAGETITTLEESVLLSGNMVVVMIISLVSIFFYKNRKRQLMICWVNFIFILIFPLVMYFAIEQAGVLKFDPSVGKISFAIFIPAVLLILDLMAIRGIKSDEELIRSMNRLR